MELYIGGYGQGKLEYVLRNYGADIPIIYEPSRIDNYKVCDKVIFNAFQEWFRSELQKGENPEDAMNQVLAWYPSMLIISNEVGNGIVPMDVGERAYRERLGRYLCQLASQAERVERVICGIGQRLK